MERSRREILEGVLYQVSPDETLHIIPPRCSQELFEEVHQGPYGAHLSAKQTYGQLSPHYWLAEMMADIKA